MNSSRWNKGKSRISGVLLAALLLACSFVFFCGNPQTSEKARVITSVFPLLEFARAVSGERGEVSLLLPPGAEIHTWQPRPSDIVRLSSADLFIFIGARMEPWLDGILKSIKNPGLQVLEASQGLALMDAGTLDETEDHGHLHGTLDPHVWLDFGYDQVIVDRIAAALSGLDPEGSPIYRENALAYKEKLRQLDRKYQESLADCDKRTFILGGHAAFGYLARRYNLRQVSLHGLSPDSRPTPKKMVEVAELARKTGVRVIFFEAYLGNKLARVLADEVGARTLVLNPGANLTREQLESGMTFFDIMEENLRNLRDGLGCR